MDGGGDDCQTLNHLRAWREYRGLTQTQLAALVDTQGSVISLLESGDRRLSDKWLRRLALPLSTTPGLLLDYDPEHIDQAVLETFNRLPEEKRPDTLASLDRQFSPRARTGEVPEPPQEKVVKGPKPKRKDVKAPRSRSSKAR
ncbi:MAG TPA: helix-turn-helix transcriptional regulator [Caulobacteraceae bacterium]|jgi:transcriptional regulator with XRE-family HTH domain